VAAQSGRSGGDLAEVVQETVPMMRRYELSEPLPPDLATPLRFREQGGSFEGMVDHPTELVEKFEPIDVLNGATELVDQNGISITIDCEDPAVIDSNEYPRSFDGVYYTIH
jgi:hypothetical protein